MLSNAIGLIASGAAAFAIVFTVWTWRGRGWRNFTHWWDGEGLPLFMVLWMLAALVLTSTGFIRNA